MGWEVTGGDVRHVHESKGLRQEVQPEGGHRARPGSPAGTLSFERDCRCLAPPYFHLYLKYKDVPANQKREHDGVCAGVTGALPSIGTRDTAAPTDRPAAREAQRPLAASREALLKASDLGFLCGPI